MGVSKEEARDLMIDLAVEAEGVGDFLNCSPETIEGILLVSELCI